VARAHRRALPGFGLSLGYALLYLSLLVLIPLGGCVVKASELSLAEFWEVVTHPQVVAAYKLGFGIAFAAALFNGMFGLLAAWVLVRYEFPGKRLLDALVDFPLALPTAVAGLTYSSLYAPNGWLGRALFFLEPEKWYDGPPAMALVLAFVSLPFVIRSVQPVLAEFDVEQEEAAACLGANRWQTFSHVILPALVPAWLTGFALAYARALGEYGSVVFVSSNLPYQTEIPPLLIVSKLEQFKYAEAAAIGVVLLLFALVTLLIINLLERWSKRHEQPI
jgi:sulfate transport system permease protein